MIGFNEEPLIKVGLVSAASEVRLTLKGRYIATSSEAIDEGDYVASIEGGAVMLTGGTRIKSGSIALAPEDFDLCSIVVHSVTIGIDFHWQRTESQRFQGAIKLIATHQGITVINELPLESYLVSVISSEMSASCPAELLRAHAIVSRSWLLAQLCAARGDNSMLPDSSASSYESSYEILRWYNRESHLEFDVCADDHCQRYQGISKAFSDEAFNAVQATRGKVIVYGREICDARYSKSCGGMTEVYRAAWEDKDVPYLAAVYDGEGELHKVQLPLTDEENARAWIESSPAAFCNAASPALLARILPDFDQETQDFFRWTIEYTQDELREILLNKLSLDFGRILALEPLERGESGRIIRLKITGEKRSLHIGKELEIRRALSRSHLYSSAFVVHADGSPYATRFRLNGAGWGHGVGLCQIGAAVMADRGYTHEEILRHYFRGVSLKALY
ncbi:MAG TPA: SpoIID/LytB domain-containing protein [Blastocatellia bacterium]|nr:SpoIID/LytB domain-containing protein [Blastocatellia bacterium]